VIYPLLYSVYVYCQPPIANSLLRVYYVISINGGKIMSEYIEYKVHVYADGETYWYFKDKLHNEAGPAVTCANGHKVWCLDGVMHTESGHKEEMKRRNNTCNGKVVTIDGKQYKLTEAK
jgi:hypothetical protein